MGSDQIKEESRENLCMIMILCSEEPTKKRRDKEPDLRVWGDKKVRAAKCPDQKCMTQVSAMANKVDRTMGMCSSPLFNASWGLHKPCN